MILSIPHLLDRDTVAALRARLDAPDAPWVDGRVSAGYSGAPVKLNQQIDELSGLAAELGDRILALLERNPLFISFAVPNQVYPPMFNRYGEGMTFGNHVDGSVRISPATGRKIRADLSITVFLSDPADYDGGELLIEDTYGVHEVKLPAGDAIVYPASSLHRVSPVTRGVRVASFFWIQCLVRDDAKRTILFDLDNAIQRLNATSADDAARRTLVGCYHNLLRQWSET
ncbi:Fe2+-dependent dioxygenase [Pararobbsia silviterrae]|uniref:Fe2+-dependent dioxygenase n=1 Tax=Pararobbsia silviterrae TaxID=1792498 RepID=A0A494YC16_9BURK|nr:Fe2+-dependent dioxygenase [Pararobbsia silviterrae]RKP59330.1 Fe2+-dependent dioxygenase [Pararobbsia silviterrae]